MAQELTDDLSYCFTVIATAPSLLFSPSSSCSILWEQEREEGVREEKERVRERVFERKKPIKKINI